jgi:TP901 family phage tail tape measure protein
MAFSVSFAFKAIDQYSKTMKQIARATQGQAKAIDALNKALKENRQQIDDSAKSVKLLSGRFSRSATNVDKYTKAVRESTAATNEQEKAIRKLSNMGVFGGKGGSPKSKTMYNQYGAGAATMAMMNSNTRLRNGIGPHGWGALSRSQADEWKAQLRRYSRGKGFEGMKMNYADFNRVSAAQAASNISSRNSFSGLSSKQSRDWSAQLARYKNGDGMSGIKKGKSFWGKFGVSRDLNMAGFSLTALGGAILAPFVYGAKAVVDFDEGIARVKKIIKGSNPKGEGEFQVARKAVLDLGKNTAMSLNDISEIMASAAAGGVKTGDLKGFTEKAIQTSIAFDMDAGSTIKAMLAAKAGGKMSLPQLYHYLEQTNMLDNLSNAEGRDILAQTGNVLGTAKNMNMKSGDAAAFVTTMIGNKIGEASAQDTNFMNLAKLAAPSTMSNPAQAALIALYNNGKPIKNKKQGTDILKTLRDNMSTNATETLIDFLTRIHAQKHPKDYTGKIFRQGLPQESIMALSQSLPTLRDNLKIARGNVDGSLSREYLARMETYIGLWKMLQNRVNIFFVTLGDAINKNDHLKKFLFGLAKAFGDILTHIENFITKHPKLAAGITILIISAGLLTLGLGALMFAISGLNEILIAWEILMAAGTMAMGNFGIKTAWMSAETAASTIATAKLGSAMALLTNPITLAAAALGVLYLTNSDFRDSVNSFVKGAGSSFLLWLKQAAQLADNLSEKIVGLRSLVGMFNGKGNPEEFIRLSHLADDAKARGDMANYQWLSEQAEKNRPGAYKNFDQADENRKQMLMQAFDLSERAEKTKSVVRIGPKPMWEQVMDSHNQLSNGPNFGIRDSVKQLTGQTSIAPLKGQLDVHVYDHKTTVNARNTDKNSQVKYNTGTNMAPPKTSAGGW